MLEKAGAEVLAERERTAARVRDELAAAGLPLVAPGLSHGVEVTVDPFADGAGGVYVSWRSSPRLQSRVLRAAKLNLLDDPVLAQQGAVLQAMLAAVTAILEAAGFTVRDSLNDYAPCSLEVLAAPHGNPTWEPHEEEAAGSRQPDSSPGESASRPD
ncbi:hypothetical protein [Streptomyces sp. NPDC058739]|uniref:hypothetical protein n=1 Tax=Streptomyces sp. NPDC058739 TaxID=3346618 RepID=UPI003685D385